MSVKEKQSLEVTKEVLTEKDLEKLGVPTEVVEQIRLKLNKDFSERIEGFKDTYHKYAQAGRNFSSTHVRRVKRRDRICFINLENDTLLIERVIDCDGDIITSKSYEYPLSLIKTIEIKLFPLTNLENRIVIHIAIANTSSLDIASKMRNLSDSVFLKNILKYGQRGLSDKPIFKILIASVIGAVSFYFALLFVFRKAIVQIVGEITDTTPQE